MAELVASGVAPVKVVYHDGGSHESFVTAMAGVSGSDGSLVVDTRMRDKFGDVSRPEGLSSGPQEIVLDAAASPKRELPSTALAFASAPKAAPAAQAAQAPAAAASAQEMKVASATPAPSTRNSRFAKPLLQENAHWHRRPVQLLVDLSAGFGSPAGRRSGSADPAKGPGHREADRHDGCSAKARAVSRTGQPSGRAIDPADGRPEEPASRRVFSCRPCFDAFRDNSPFLLR